jgi:beta-glucosidase/6-phospho-beta-glucosidase/beta-galactosidase
VVTGDPTGEGRVPRAADTVAAAHADGVRVVGAFHLPAIDGYEWHRGFDVRLGLFDRDRNPKDALGAIVPTVP